MQLNSFSLTALRRAQVAEYEPAEMSITVSGTFELNDDPAVILPAVARALANVAAHAVARGELDAAKLEAIKRHEAVPPTAAVEVKRRPGRPRKNPVPEPEIASEPELASEPEPAPEPEPVPEPEPEPVPDPEPIKEPAVEDDFLFDDPKPEAPKWDVSSLDAFRRQVLAIASKLGPTGAEKIRAVRAAFGVERIQDIPQPRWVEFLDKIAALS